MRIGVNVRSCPLKDQVLRRAMHPSAGRVGYQGRERELGAAEHLVRTSSLRASPGVATRFVRRCTRREAASLIESQSRLLVAVFRVVTEEVPADE